MLALVRMGGEAGAWDGGSEGINEKHLKRERKQSYKQQIIKRQVS